MARPLRIEYPGAYYHVMNRGLARGDIFLNTDDREHFFTLLGETCQLWTVKIYAYCLMDTHYHLLLQTPRAGLSRVMRHIDGIYTQRFNRAHHRDGPLFRGRYKAILIDAEAYFLSVARYIHHNPVQAGIASDIARYPWSSHSRYLDAKRGPAWLDTTPLLSRFGRGQRAITAYRNFMGATVEPEIQAYYDGAYQKPVLGDKEFVTSIRAKLGSQARIEREKPESRRVFGVEIAEVLEATAQIYQKPVSDLGRKRRGEENEARAMAIFLCRTLGGHTLAAIGMAVGLENYSSVSSAVLRMKHRVNTEERLARRVRHITNRLLQNKEHM